MLVTGLKLTVLFLRSLLHEPYILTFSWAPHLRIFCGVTSKSELYLSNKKRAKPHSQSRKIPQTLHLDAGFGREI